MTDTPLMLVSYPRSGQHYTQRMIERVTGVDDYCELYHCSVPDCPGKKKPIAEKIPCPSGRRVQKNHDFELDLGVEPQFNYAILLRYPLNSIISYYEQEVRRHGVVQKWHDDGTLTRVDDTAEAWFAFLENRAAYWNDFARKWVALAQSHDNVRLFRYEGMCYQDEAQTFVGFFDFFLGEVAPTDKVTALIDLQSENMRRQNRLPIEKPKDFRYGTDRSIEVMERVIDHDLLRDLGYEVRS